MTLVYLTGAWLLGILAGAVAGDVWWPAAVAIASVAIAAALLERRPQLLLVGALSAGLFIAGAAHYERSLPSGEPEGIALHNSGGEDAPETRFRAVVSDEPEVRGRSQRVRLDVREVYFGGAWVGSSGGVLMRAPLRPEYRYGDLVELRGQLEEPPSFPDFDYREYLARQGIVSVIDYPVARTIGEDEGNPAMAVVHSVRRTLGDSLEAALPEPHAALAQGILLGQRTSISPGLTADLNATGTSHLVAVSGQNVAIIAGLTITALAWLIGRRRAAMVALLVIAGYALLTGASPPVVRAAIMGGLFVVAEMSGRPASALVLILTAAAVMTGLDPLIVEDVSFQLSFAAIMGLVYLTPLLHARGAESLRARGIEPDESALVAFLLGSTAVTMGAILATLPITALNFERVSVVAPLANLVVVPAFPLILATSGITALAGAVWAPLGMIAGWPAWAPLTYMIESVSFFADLPLASIEISDFTSLHAAVGYLALVAGGLWLARRRVPAWHSSEPTMVVSPQVRPVWMLTGGLAVAASFAWWTALGGESDRLSVTFLDVGQGDAMLIETPSGQQILIDGGPDGTRLIEALSGELPFWDREIDAVVLTHAQDDHLTGLLEALERYDVALATGPSLSSDSASEQAWRDAIENGHVPYRPATAGDVIDLGDGAVLRVLAPGRAGPASNEPNDASIVVEITWGEIDFLLTGDIEAAGERALLASGADIESDVLKVAHHGSATSTTAPFLATVDPEIAVISAGARNPFGHPAAQTLERLGGTAVFRTDLHGTISISTDGERLWVDAER